MLKYGFAVGVAVAVLVVPAAVAVAVAAFATTFGCSSQWKDVYKRQAKRRP